MIRFADVLPQVIRHSRAGGSGDCGTSEQSRDGFEKMAAIHEMAIVV
jgi:hypothetical protein